MYTLLIISGWVGKISAAHPRPTISHVPPPGRLPIRQSLSNQIISRYFYLEGYSRSLEKLNKAPRSGTLILSLHRTTRELNDDTYSELEECLNYKGRYRV